MNSSRESLQAKPASPGPRYAGEIGMKVMHSMYVKICGLRNPDMARHAIAVGADAIGVVMSDKSPRHTDPETARSIVAAAKEASPSIDTVLVVREMPAVQAANTARHLGFDVLQLHGGYSAEDFREAKAILPRIWRATSIFQDPGVSAGEFGEEHLLLDGSDAGSGVLWDLSKLSEATLGDSWLLAGGLSPTSVHQTIRKSRPWGVDVSSGVESTPGIKDPELITQFIHAARANDS